MHNESLWRQIRKWDPMNRQNSLQISIESVETRGLAIPAEYRTSVCNLRTQAFDPLPNGQAVAVHTSLLEPENTTHRYRYQYSPPCGLTNYLSVMAYRQRVDVRVPERPVLPLPEPIRSPSIVNPAVGDFIHGYSSGTIEYGGEITKADLLTDICLSFPGERILFLSPHTSELNRLAHALTHRPHRFRVLNAMAIPQTADEVILESRATAKVILSTPANLQYLAYSCGVDLSNFPIIVYSDVSRTYDLHRAYMNERWSSRCRLFGLRHESSRLSRLQEDHAAATFGCYTVQLPETGRVKSAIFVGSVLNPYKIRNLRPQHSVAEKARLSHRCTNRNSLIATLARNIASRSWADLDDLTRRWLDEYFLQPSAIPGVVVLVHDLKQAARLLQRLPEWSAFMPLEAPDDVTLGLPTADRRTILQRASCYSLGPTICPIDFFGTFLTHYDPSVIIQATAMEKSPAFPDRWFHRTFGSRRSRLVLEINDDAVKSTARLYSSRMASYASHGFLTLSEESLSDPELFVLLFRVNEFLDRTVRLPRRRGGRR